MTYKLLSKLYYSDKDSYNRIYEQRFHNDSTYHFNIKIHDHEAFCQLCPEIYKLNDEISCLDKKVYDIVHFLPKVAIKQFVRKSLVDEIILTNDIEGVYSTRREINRILNDIQCKYPKDRFWGMVTKYNMLGKDEILLATCEDIRKIYDELVLPEIISNEQNNKPDGKIFRKELAEVTSATQKVIHVGLYPEDKIIDAMEQALKILNNDEIPCLMRVSVFHYLFGYIHPFYDGNGRTSRFISSYLLSKQFEYIIGYRLSYTIKENITEYYEGFKICNNPKNLGDLTPFVIMFMNIIKKSFENLYESLYIKKENLIKYHEKICNIDGIDSELSYILLQAALFSKIGVNKQDLCKMLEISESTLRSKLKDIEKLGYLVLNKEGRVHYYSFDINKI